jgi:hypothetical protein
MTRAKLLLASVAVLAAACDLPPSAPEPAPVAPSLARMRLNERFPFTLTFANPCPPAEPVVVDGTLHVVQQGQTEETGSTTRTHLNMHGSGVGVTTGTSYQLVQTGRQEATTTTTPFGITTESLTRFGLIREGSLDNVFVTARLRVVCTEDGCVVEVDETETECRG